MEDKKGNSDQNWWNFIWSYIRGALFEEIQEILSVVMLRSALIGLFILIGLAIIFYAITISAPYFAKTSEKSADDISKASFTFSNKPFFFT